MTTEQEKKPYTIQFKRSAERELRKIGSRDLARMTNAIDALASNPRPPGVQKLADVEAYRVRQGDHRIVYTIDDARKIVEVIKIGHRREVYR